MDAYEATKVVLERIQAVDPENAAKIMGLLLLQDNGEKEMIRLAFGPDPLLLAAVSKARSHLGLARPAPPPPPYYDDLHNLSFFNDAASAASAAACYGWRPCLYFARGYCKNGASCRFLHGAPVEASALDAAVEQQCHDLLIRSKSQHLMSAAFPYSPTSPVPPSPSSMNKCPSFLLPESQRSAAALMLGGDDPNKFIARSPRMMERSDLAGISNPSARQIYLTFPADSTFREEDVSNYFSNYGPVQDVRIPYQQKRMFGFVTFVFPETVRLILAKGNPHFVCDARVLVKPYKEKGKVPDKYRKQQQGDFSGSSTPTGALDARDTSDLQQLGAVRMLYGGSGLGQEVMLRRRLDELQQAAELQQAIELHSRRFMGLQLLDLKSRSLRSAGSQAITNVGLEEQAPPMLEEKSTATAALSQMAVNSTADKEVEESIKQASSNQVSGFQECADHNLPDSPFASPTKASYAVGAFAATSSESDTASRHNIDGNLLPNATLDMASFKSCFFPLPRFSSGHGAVGM